MLTGALATQKTDADGTFLITDLNSGKYTISTRIDGRIAISPTLKFSGAYTNLEAVESTMLGFRIATATRETSNWSTDSALGTTGQRQREVLQQLAGGRSSARHTHRLGL
jgi:hypothetical protein